MDFPAGVAPSSTAQLIDPNLRSVYRAAKAMLRLLLTSVFLNVVLSEAPNERHLMV
jgi:hypothetical protein